MGVDLMLRYAGFRGLLRGLSLSLIAALLVLSAPQDAAARKYASIVVDAETGQVLHASSADRLVYPASLTKVMTLYMLFDALERGELRLNQKLTVSKRAAGMAPSKLGLRAGEKITVENVIYSLVTKSANDMAVVAAEALGGTEIKFAQMMTKRARELGMRNTTFRNASGLPNTGQQSTVRDLATLGRALLANHPKYYHYFSTKEFGYNGNTYRSHNRLMLRYAGADGIKTGYISASGFNLLTSAVRDGRRIVAVVVGGRTARSRDDHMAQLLDKGFSRVHTVRSAKAKIDLTSPDVVAALGQKPDLREEPVFGSETDEIAGLVSLYGVGDAEEADWAIQVGAFSNSDPAELAVRMAKDSLSGAIAGGTPLVQAVEIDNATLYRARLTGMTEDQARNACRRLVAANSSCRVVPPSAL